LCCLLAPSFGLPFCHNAFLIRDTSPSASNEDTVAIHWSQRTEYGTGHFETFSQVEGNFFNNGSLHHVELWLQMKIHTLPVSERRNGDNQERYGPSYFEAKIAKHDIYPSLEENHKFFIKPNESAF
jgi:hypothetical protein